jgi:hypothetical protein
MNRIFGFGLLTAALLSATVSPASAQEPPLNRSARSGPWSAKETWELGRVPTTGDRVVIRAGHRVAYDVESPDVIRLVQVAGTLEFARDRNTRLDVGLLTVVPNEEPSEEGFDCHAPVKRGAEADKHRMEGARPALLIGSPGSPIPGKFKATVRLHYVAGMDKESCPAIVCCGGRMELHGEPMRQTWVRLKRPIEVGATSIAVAEAVADWKEGDRIIVTGTQHHREGRGDRDGSGGFLDRAETETARVVRVGGRDFTGGFPVKIDVPLKYAHFADDRFQAEVANLSRNVAIESADPDGLRGHTMYHRNSAGSISYVEFRHLGKKDVLGRYSLHFHLCGDTMRGSSVVGASIWDSHNRWLTIHGTDGLVVRDCVGYKSIGHGYFLEDGSEVHNIFDHNLAALVAPGKPLPKQVIPYDLNRGAGFWWANCRNNFTRNVAAECAEYGYRFDCKKTEDFDPVMAIRQPDGTVKTEDTRVMPFIRFEDNEAHTMRFFCLNLRGITRPAGGGLALYEQNETLAREASEAMPDPSHPFWIRNFKAWDANWAIHLGTTGVFVDGLDVYKSDVAIWRSIMDRSGFRRMTTKEMRVNDIHNPLSMGPPSREEKASFRGMSSFVDSLAPVTLITSAVRDGNSIRICGSVSDTSDIKYVKVNGRPARSTRGSFAEWEITLDAPAGQAFDIAAFAEDASGNVERGGHKLRVD